MNDVDRFTALLGRIGVGLPRGVLGPDARALARAVADGDRDTATIAALRRAAAAEHWPQLRLAIGAALDRASGTADDPALADARALVDREDANNPLALALVDDAVSLLAAVMVRTDERLAVLDRRLAADGGGDDLTRTVGDIVVDLLDLDPEDYEDEIADFLRVGQSDASRANLARATGDDEIRTWAREELAEATAYGSGHAASALGRLAASDPPEDPADDPVWTAAILALVDEAVEIATVNQVLEPDAGSEPLSEPQ
ncbi:MAG TPA: hypothetical protein PLV41_06040 [Miltoncostaeales bacterium]|nr:hypothetical protein [Miltoncostaeales bacterium]